MLWYCICLITQTFMIVKMGRRYDRPLLGMNTSPLKPLHRHLTSDVLLSPSHPSTRWLQNSVTPPLPVSTTRSVATPAASSTDAGMPRDSTLEL